MDAHGRREIVSAADGHRQPRCLLHGQRAQVTVQRAVAAKNQGRIGFVSWIELMARKDVDARQLKRPHEVFFRKWSQNRNGTHGERVAYRTRKSKFRTPARSSIHFQSYGLRSVHRFSCPGNTRTWRRLVRNANPHCSNTKKRFANPMRKYTCTTDQSSQPRNPAKRTKRRSATA